MKDVKSIVFIVPNDLYQVLRKKAYEEESTVHTIVREFLLNRYGGEEP